MGFLARFAICIGIVYWLSPEPTGYRADYAMRPERERAVEVLTALTVLGGRGDVSRDEIEALAVKAGQALAVLDPETRRTLIERYFGPGGAGAPVQGLVN